VIKVTISGNNDSELLIDYQQGVGFTVLFADKTQVDFSIEPHEWDVLKTFLDNQRALETAVSQEVQS
jgi:hypothetical protein